MSGLVVNDTLSNAPTITVSSASELIEAVENAVGGETILLEPGHYGDILFHKIYPDAEITIKSADPSDQAVFSSVKIHSSSNITMDSVFVDLVPDESTTRLTKAVDLKYASNITFQNSTIEGGEAVSGIDPDSPVGTENPSGNVLGLPAARAVAIVDSETIVFDNMEISEFHKGILLSGVSEFTLTDSEIHSLRTTPIHGV
ncbi:MAG: hypothetical protein AAFN16_14300, partial [Pseudomonadota bacterium]